MQAALDVYSLPQQPATRRCRGSPGTSATTSRRKPATTSGFSTTAKRWGSTVGGPGAAAARERRAAGGGLVLLDSPLPPHRARRIYRDHGRRSADGRVHRSRRAPERSSPRSASATSSTMPGSIRSIAGTLTRSSTRCRSPRITCPDRAQFAAHDRDDDRHHGRHHQRVTLRP